MSGQAALACACWTARHWTLSSGFRQLTHQGQTGPYSGNSSGGSVRSFQPIDERACTDHMLAMEACKISDRGQLNSGTAEPFLDSKGI